MTETVYIARGAEKEFLTLIQEQNTHRDILLVEGARQVGKTRLTKHVLTHFPHIWLDLQEEKAFVRKIDATSSFHLFSDLLAAEKGFVPGQGKILVIDEAQESEKLGAYVRYMKEVWENQTVILLGSMMSRLFRKGIKYPVGRTKHLRIFPMTFFEFLKGIGEDLLLEKLQTWNFDQPLSPPFHAKAITLFDQYLKVGGLPEVVFLYGHQKNW